MRTLVEQRQHDLESIHGVLLHDAAVYDRMAELQRGAERATSIFNATLQRARAAMIAKALGMSA